MLGVNVWIVALFQPEGQPEVHNCVGAGGGGGQGGPSGLQNGAGHPGVKPDGNKSETVEL